MKTKNVLTGITLRGQALRIHSLYCLLLFNAYDVRTHRVQYQVSTYLQVHV